jgi:hypothetical protein
MLNAQVGRRNPTLQGADDEVLIWRGSFDKISVIRSAIEWTQKLPFPNHAKPFGSARLLD